MRSSRLWQVALFAMPALLLLGCSQEAEVKEWMERTKQDTRVVIPKIAEPKTYTPFKYEHKDSVDPFNSVKLSAALAKMRAQSGKGIRPDLERRREPLEQYPLDTIKMVGLLQKPGMTYAILQMDKLIFQAKVGNYIGQNFGMITNVTDEGMDIKEIVQDAAGEWVERRARLELQESGQTGKQQENKK